MIRILLADDFTIIRKGVRQILTQAYPTAQIEEVGEGEEWTDKLRDRRWDMIISVLPKSDEGGYSVLQRIREDFPALPVLILSLGKDAAPEELLWAVRQILAGKKYIGVPRDN
ncbi:MAG TPA: response regulator [Puia sp.]|jgi:DNA-binding NarL/FixJ family response regulator|nr:response regulator [Puia sp.]